MTDLTRTRSMLGALQRTIWFSALLLAGLVILLALVLFGFGGGLPDLTAPAGPRALANPPLGEPIPDMFTTSAVPAIEVSSNVVNPFFTLHFQPPAPPPTKKVPLLYLGCVESSTRVLRAYVRVSDKLQILPLGEKVIADYAIQDISITALVLTNTAGQTSVFGFKTNATIEVPAN